MFGVYKINNNVYNLGNGAHHLDPSNLEFYKKINSLNDFKLSINQRISKYSLMKNGWCFVTKIDELGITTPLYVVIDTDSDRVLNTILIPLFRELKLEEILD